MRAALVSSPYPVLTNAVWQPALAPAEMMARVLAMFRAEGSCAVPPEADTLADSGPGVPLPPGRSRFDAPGVGGRIYARCVTALFDSTKIATAIPEYYYLYFGGGTPPKVEQVGDFEFTVMLGGLDIMWVLDMQTAAENLVPSNPPFVQNDRFDWWR